MTSTLLTTVCLHGWYGEDCGKKCNVNCRNGCMSKTGECVNGCSIPGVQPPLCDKGKVICCI